MSQTSKNQREPMYYSAATPYFHHTWDCSHAGMTIWGGYFCAHCAGEYHVESDCAENPIRMGAVN